MELTIPAIKRTVGLLMKANCEDFATVQETAREMKVTKTALMAFIDDNHKHFKTAQRIVQKVKGGRILSEKNLGRVILGVYERADLNPFEREYLERVKAEWKRTVYIEEYKEYDEHLCYYLPEDTQRKDTYGKPVTEDDNRKTPSSGGTRRRSSPRSLTPDTPGKITSGVEATDAHESSSSTWSTQTTSRLFGKKAGRSSADPRSAIHLKHDDTSPPRSRKSTLNPETGRRHISLKP